MSGTMKNLANILSCRETNQSSLGRCNRGFEQSALNCWAEADFLRHASSEYVELRPSPRSSIAAAFSSDGRYLASTHGDHTVKVTDVATGKVIHSLAGHRRTPWVVRFSPVDPDIMASGSLDFTAAVWQVSTGRMLHKYDFGKPIASLAFDPSGTMLVVSAGHKVFSWRFARLAAPVKILKTRRSLRALHFHPAAPHILLTAEVTERRATGPADAGGAATAAAPAAAGVPQPLHANHPQRPPPQQQPQGQTQSQMAGLHRGGGGWAEGAAAAAQDRAPEELGPQDVVDDLAAFIAERNSLNPTPGLLRVHQRYVQQVMAMHLSEQQQRQQGDAQQRHQHQAQEQQQRHQQAQRGGVQSAPGASGGARAANHTAQAHAQAAGPAAWPMGLLRNFLTGVTGVLTGSLGGAGAGGGGGAAAGIDGAPATAPRGAGSFATVTGSAAVAAAAGGGGGGGAPSVNPGGGSGGGGALQNPHVAHSSLPGNLGGAATAATAGPDAGVSGAGAPPQGGGRLSVLAPEDIVRYESLGGGVRHAIPLVAQGLPPPVPREARVGAPASGGGAAVAAAAPDPNAVPYDLTWGWDPTLDWSDNDVAVARELAVRGGPDLPSAANHDTPCIVTVRLWDFREPARELKKELLVLPRVVLCSEMGIHFSSCGRYMVCCVVREIPSGPCQHWQATQAAMTQAGGSHTHAHPPSGPGGLGGAEGPHRQGAFDHDAGPPEEEGPGGGESDRMDELAEATQAAAGSRGGGAAVEMTEAGALGSPGSCRSVEMSEAEARPRGSEQRSDGGMGGGAAGGGEHTVAWLGGGRAEVHGEYDDENLYDTATQACGPAPTAAVPSAARLAGWRRPDDGGSDGDGDAMGPAISAMSLQQRQTPQRLQPGGELADALSEVSRPGAAQWEAEYDSREAATYCRAAAAASAVSGVARGGSSGGGGDYNDAHPHRGSTRPSISRSLRGQGGGGAGGGPRGQPHFQHHPQPQGHIPPPPPRFGAPHDLQVSRRGAAAAAAAAGAAAAAAAAAAGHYPSLQPQGPGHPPPGVQQWQHQQQHQQQNHSQQQPQHQNWHHHNHHYYHHAHNQQQQQQYPQAPNTRGRVRAQQADPAAGGATGGVYRTAGREAAPPLDPGLSRTNALPIAAAAQAGAAAAAASGPAGAWPAASVGPAAAQAMPSTFASIKAQLALQRSRDGAAPVATHEGRPGGTIASPEGEEAANHGGSVMAATAAATAAAAAAGMRAVPTASFAVTAAAGVAGGVAGPASGAQRADAAVAVTASDGDLGGFAATAAAAAPAPPGRGFRPCYELCIFYTGTSPIPPTAAAAIATATAAISAAPAPGNAAAATAPVAAITGAATPSSSSSVAFPAAHGLAGLANGGGATTTATTAAVTDAAPSASASAIGPHFGSLLYARPVLAAHCMTSVQLSPTGDHVLLAYGRRHISLCSLVSCDGRLAAVHSVVEIYSVPDLILRRVLLSSDDEVNVAVFNAFAAEGMAYGTKEGRLRLIRHDRRPPLRSAIPFVPLPSSEEEEGAGEEDEAGMGGTAAGNHPQSSLLSGLVRRAALI